MKTGTLKCARLEFSDCRVKPHFGRSGGGRWSREEGSSGGESGERPNFGRTHEKFEHTPHRHTTTRHTHTTTGDPAQVLDKGGPSQGGPWPRKQDMSNKLSRRAAPLAKVFNAQVWAKNVSKVVRAKCGQKNQKNMEKQIRNIPLPFTQNKKSTNKKNKKNFPKIKK